MAKKIDIGKMIASLKAKSNPNLNDKITEALAPKLYRERDMRQEAMDIGAHQAKDYFGGNESD